MAGPIPSRPTTPPGGSPPGPSRDFAARPTPPSPAGSASAPGATGRPASAVLTAPAPNERRRPSWTAGPDTRTQRPWVSRPEPRLRQLMGVCGWAAVLGGVGLIIGIRGFIAVLGNDTPGWYEPTMVSVGLAGIALTVGAFLTVHRRIHPWLMLGLSSLALIVSMVLTSAAL